MIFRIGIFYVLTWFFLILLGGVQQATRILPPEIGLAQWGPGIAALVMLVVFRKDGFKITFFSKGTPVLRYVYAALIPVGVSLVVYLIKSMMSIQPPSNSPAYGAILTMVLWMPFGAIGEELGWRGYLHKKLDPRMRGLWSSLLVGLLWMPIHVAFYPQGAVFLFFLALLIISYSVMIYALVHDTGFNVLLASVFHMFINLANLLFLDVIYATPFMIINALAWVILAIWVIIMKKDIFIAAK